MRISGKKQPSMPHGLTDETPHRGYVLAQDLAFVQPEVVSGLKPCVKFAPDTIIRPFVAGRLPGDIADRAASPPASAC